MNLTLTGPRSVGKSTIGKLLAKELKLKYISSDKIGDKALKKHGGLDRATKSGIIKSFIKNKGYNLITDVYKKEKDYVFDLSGGSFTYKTFPKASLEVRKYAKRKSKIIGLLPSTYSIISIPILFKREINREHFKDAKKFPLFWKTALRYYRFPKIFRAWADLVIYTKGKTPKQVVDEIKRGLNLK